MKIPVQILSFMLGLAFAFNLYAQEFSSPVKYFEYLNAQHAVIVNKNMEYVQYAVHSDDWMTVEQKRIELIDLIQSTIENVEGLPGYEENTKMKEELLAVLREYHASFEIEFNEVNLLKKDSKESYEAMERYLAAQDAAERKLADAADRFQSAQQDFADNNRIILVENEGNSQIDELNKLNAYQRAVFLKYFKVSKKNSEFQDAMDKKDPTLMDQFRVELLEDAKQNLKILQLMPDFKGDTEYRDSAVRIVEFYKDLAAGGYLKVIEVLRKDELTQEDVDAYNSVIGLYNNKIPELTGTFNQATDNLLRKNVPKPVAVKRI